MKGFVGFTRFSSPDDLRNLLGKLSNEQSYYFLRSPHQVSGISIKRPDEFPFPGFEGQMFNYEREVRWKKQRSGYDVLLLSRVEADLNLGMQSLPGKWEICDRNAYFYDIDETKFPKGFIYKGVNDEDINPKNIPIAQRYFKDSDTATVHFVALTVTSKND